MIFGSELPPDEYYEKLGPILTEKFKGCDHHGAKHSPPALGPRGPYGQNVRSVYSKCI